MNRVLRSRRVFRFCAAFVTAVWAPILVSKAYIWAFPPLVSHGLIVLVEDGVPVEVIEERDILRDFYGRWHVTAESITNSSMICPDLPPGGPQERTYRKSTTRSFPASWKDYTGDTESCVQRIMRHPGVARIRVFRSVRVLPGIDGIWDGIWVDLPVSESEFFEVGGASAHTADRPS